MNIKKKEKQNKSSRMNDFTTVFTNGKKLTNIIIIGIAIMTMILKVQNT
jgi:hypothetical protein